jgi:uncharacterized damage-inducible protein DinB
MSTYIEKFSYNSWANLILLDPIAQQESEVFRKKIKSSFPSLQETFLHIYWAEELWLARWENLSYSHSINPDEYQTVEILRNAFENLFQKQSGCLKRLNPEDESEVIAYQNTKGEHWEYRLDEMMQHLLFHSAYHRGQVVTLLRQEDVDPPGTDFLVYLDKQNANS